MLDEKVKKSTTRDPSSPPDCIKETFLKWLSNVCGNLFFLKKKNQDHLANILIELQLQA
jgi:hypothetical protein